MAATAMKGLSMNKMLGSIRKKTGGGGALIPVLPYLSPFGRGARRDHAVSRWEPAPAPNRFAEMPPPASAATPAENPEVTAHNSVKAFCESGGNAQSDEVLFLPPIVDAAESSPAAAAECARIIRKYMGKEYSSRPSWQYNAIMLVRILTDNPGQTFTRNLDDKFVETAKALLKNARDRSVRQILMETLDDFEHTKMYDDGLAGLIQMWKKEKEKALKDYGGRVPPAGPRPHLMSPPPMMNRHSQNYFAKAHSNNRLPDPVELASRLEEARTSAKLLEQVVMNTPSTEMLQNELIREFANRCLSASRSIQGYMTSENPGPDNDTMESLIDTNEQLQTALNQHQRAVLNARKQLGLNTPHEGSPGPEATNGTPRQDSFPAAAGAGAAVVSGANGKGKQAEVYDAPDGPPPPSTNKASGSGYRRLHADDDSDGPAEDPFADPHPGQGSSSAFADLRLAQEPFNPGFQAASKPGLGDDKEAVNGSGASSTTGLQPPPPPPGGQRKGLAHDDDDDDDDIYEATPKSKEPINRY
ncbi:VHS domain-containing protein [Purpureocillium lavendulum]|uniref:VHS domain-containing protein n=1 Tax=Purpureocillium lavendulum TaxID=1247861 RepID=A0AB34FSI1_9HYPO|nr:VHS domain-containing protein [Purpureocillium lavendulum]